MYQGYTYPITTRTQIIRNPISNSNNTANTNGTSYTYPTSHNSIKKPKVNGTSGTNRSSINAMNNKSINNRSANFLAPTTAQVYGSGAKCNCGRN